MSWAGILSEWSLHSTQPDLARLRREAAVQCYDQILQDDEASSRQKAEALIARGWSCFLAGRIREAIADEQHAVSLAPANWRAHANLAVALLADGQMNAALAAYDGAFALATAEELPEIDADLAVALEKYGPIPEVDQIRERIETRRRLLERERFRSPNKTTWRLREPS